MDGRVRLDVSDCTCSAARRPSCRPAARCRSRGARLEPADALERPATEDAVHQALEVRQIALTAADRDRPVPLRLDRVAHVALGIIVRPCRKPSNAEPPSRAYW